MQTSPEADSNQITLEQLEAQLQQAGVPFGDWGQGKAKTIDNLLAEIQNGECELVVSPEGHLTRSTKIIWVDVFGADASGKTYKLYEDRQEFNDGRIRQRSLPGSLGEKAKATEDEAVAAERAIEEELGIPGVSSQQVRVEQADRDSESYPGLQTHQEAWYFSATLPSEAFKPEGYVEQQAEKTNYYSWQLVDN